MISVIPIVMIFDSYHWPDANVGDSLNLINTFWLLKLLRISNTGYALRPGFSKTIIKQIYKKRLDNAIEENKDE